jgi:hypothetical protein
MRLIMSRKLDSFFLVLLIICSINFFEFQMFKDGFVKIIQYTYLFSIILISLPYLFSKAIGFVFPIQLIIFSVFISIFISTINRDQNLFDSIIGSIPVLVLVVFFYLNRIKPSIQKIEQIVIWFGILYFILFFIQFMFPGRNYFIDPDTVDDSRGITRFLFPGGGVFYLTTFIAINKLTTQKRNLWFWGMLSTLALVVCIMQVTRQVIVGMLLIYIFHFLRNINLYKKIIVLACFVSLMLYVINSNNPIVNGLRETQQQTQELGMDYVRVQAAIFFLTDFSNSTFNRIFGNGVPHGDKSPYMRYTGQYISNYGFWLSDVGLVAVYAMFGLFAVLGYILIWAKSFTIKLPKENFYLKYYLWFLLFTCLTSDSIYSPSNLIITVLVLYMYQMQYEKMKTEIAYNSLLKHTQ